MNLVVGAFWFRPFFFSLNFLPFFFFVIGNVENKGVKSEKAEEGCYDRNQPNILRPPSPAAAGSTCILRAYSSCKDIKSATKPQASNSQGYAAHLFIPGQLGVQNQPLDIFVSLHVGIRRLLAALNTQHNLTHHFEFLPVDS